MVSGRNSSANEIPVCTAALERSKYIFLEETAIS